MKKRGSARDGDARRPAADEGAERERPVASSERRDSGDAFMDDPGSGPAVIDDDLAESLAEEFIVSATTGEDSGDEAMDRIVPEEIGGPFIETSASEEFADDIDEANPEDANAEPLPRAIGGLARRPPEDR
jgi:hypothetical protein